MAKNAVNRLEKSLRGVNKWASGRSLPTTSFKEYLEGRGNIGLAVSGLSGLFVLGMEEVSQSLLAAGRGQWSLANQHMAHGFARMLYAQAIDLNNVKGSNREIIGNLDDVTHLMLGAIAMGRLELVKPFYEKVFEGIHGGYGIRDGHDVSLDSTLRYAAFGLSIIGDWLDRPLDLEKHALPRDLAWGQLVANWRNPDPDVLLPALLLACDTHVERIALTEREDDSGKFEFGSVFLAVHPTEILAVLRLRDLLGLPNPKEIDHPLMKTPYAAITCLPGAVTERDELLEQFLAVVRQRDPQVLPAGL
ncbi:hypothetical protein [Pseudomonas protegens]|uniref:hypothetical protein n=1 Tax=Pseudomonas protegens TaxID=380021 RepID=UPI00218249B5|nr:hypothetical protein [Pseudomonas protegens]